MNFDLHIGFKTEKAACAFLHLASTSSSVPPVVKIRLPRYIKVVTHSRLSPGQLMVTMFDGDQILSWLHLLHGFWENFSYGIQQVVLSGLNNISHLGSQSQCRNCFILPAHRASHITRILLNSTHSEFSITNFLFLLTIKKFNDYLKQIFVLLTK